MQNANGATCDVFCEAGRQNTAEDGDAAEEGLILLSRYYVLGPILIHVGRFDCVCIGVAGVYRVPGPGAGVAAEWMARRR